MENLYVVIDGFAYPASKLQEQKWRKAKCQEEHHGCNGCTSCIMDIIELRCGTCGHVGMQLVNGKYHCEICGHEAD